jgi:hypothetical protein
MRKLKIIIPVFLIAIIGLAALILIRKKESASGIFITHPFNNAVLPAEFPSPLFEWYATVKDTSSWQVSLVTGNKKYKINSVTRGTSWSPDVSKWDSIKLLSGFDKIYFTVKKSGKPGKGKELFFRLSKDSVGAPILYRQMPIPFVIAEKKLESMNFMLLNVGSKKDPHKAMGGFPVCGNCHSITADGSTIGLDLDAGLRDKGGYFVSPIKDTIVFNPDNYMSWSKIEKRRTFGLFSKISPDGRYIVTTIKDRVVMKNYPYSKQHIAYSQLFFPVNGRLAVYDRQQHLLNELPGANLDEYVQSNAIWTPDGKNIIFSRATALPYDTNRYEITVGNNKLIDQFVQGKKTFKYDLCIIPFNDGKGGKAEPIKGASGNGKSNYFPAVSPDGKWLIFCKAENFMLLQPDSRLYIVPAKGGEARMLGCNLPSLNSWHAWAPNSKWIVFVSKSLSPYTDMFLSHIDDEGNASIPVLVDKARVNSLVVNYPEFVNRNPQDTFIMEYDYVEIVHISSEIKNGHIEHAKQLFHKLEEQNPFLFREDCLELVYLLKSMGMTEEAKKYTERAKETINSDLFNYK